MNNEVSVLIGNGVSVAFTPELRLGSLSETVLENLSRLDDENTNGDSTNNGISSSLSQLASRMRGHQLKGGRNNEFDFEQMIGTLDTFRASAKTLKLSPGHDCTTREAIQTTVSFVDRLYRRGVREVLTTIRDKSVLRKGSPHRDAFLHFVQCILELKTEVTICNLNYDTLVLAAMQALDARRIGSGKSAYPYCDLAFTKEKTLSSEGFIDGYLLSNALECGNGKSIWDSPIRLVHLHGSICFWRQHGSKNEHVVKCTVGSLREGGKNTELWDQMLENDGPFPAVVLADHIGKTRQIDKFPFRLGYDAFRESLRRSSHWLIAGYSFGDTDVNTSLREAFREHIGNRVIPRVLVLDHGDSLCKKDILEALGRTGDIDADSWLSLNRQGALNAVEEPGNSDWTAFTDSVQRASR